MLERRAFILSTALASLAAFLVYQYLANQDRELSSQYAVFYPMVVATRDLVQYQTITPTDLEVITVPAALVPPGIIGNPQDVIDAIASVPISRGEQVLDSKIISKNVYSGLDSQVALGKRAMSIPATVRNTDSFLVRPGNRVDLAAHFEYRSSQSNISEVKTFLQDILVLAVGRTIQPSAPKGVDQALTQYIMDHRRQFEVPGGTAPEPPPDKKDVEETLNFAKRDSSYNTVTLEVTPYQAEQILYVVSAFGEISLLLRHSDDRALQDVGTANLSKVLGPDSFYVKGNKQPPPRSLPKIRFYDYMGGQRVPIYEE